MTIQVYLALIARLLVTLWAGHKPSKRASEMSCLYFAGWASETELLAYVRRSSEPKKKQ